MARHYPRWNIPTDWVEEDGFTTVLFCVPNSREWRGLITAHINTLSFGRAWDERSGDLLSVISLGREIFNSMEICDLKTSLDRIAVALESLDAKAAQFITWDEFIEDIETAFGVGSLLPAVLRAFFGLFPNITAKLNFTPIALSVWEWWSRWLPITTAVTSISVSQGIIAAATVGQKVIGLIDTVLSIFPILQTAFLGWKDIIVGDKNLWDDLIRPMIGLFAGDDVTEPTPDTSSALRPVVNVLNRTIVQNTINACCIGVPGLPQQEPPASILSQNIGPSSPDLEPNDIVGEIIWGTETDATGKCKSANYILDAILVFLENLPTQLQGQQVSLALIVAGATAAIFAIVTVLAIPVMILVTFATALIGLSTLTVILEQINELKTLLEANRLDFVCDLNLAEDSQSAAQAVQDRLIGLGASPAQLTMASCLFNNAMLAHLFYQSDLIDTSGASSSCGCFDEECAWNVTEGTGPGYPGGEYNSEIAPSGFGEVVLTAIGTGCPEQTVVVGMGTHDPVIDSFGWAIEYWNGTSTVVDSVAIGEFPITYTDVIFDMSSPNGRFRVLEQAGGRAFTCTINFSMT